MAVTTSKSNRIGEKLKKVFRKLGTSFTIIREEGCISGESLSEKPNSQATKPFIREFFRECTLPYDTQVVPGDLVKYEVPAVPEDEAEYFLVTHYNHEMFRNVPITVKTVLYKTNIVCDLLRPSGELDTQTFQTNTHWNTIKRGQRLLLTDKLYGTRLDDEEQPFMQADIASLIAFVPKRIALAAHDRLVVSGEFLFGGGVSGEMHYSVKYIERNQFSGIDLVYLEDDTRS
jgi:hypothetical protein